MYTAKDGKNFGNHEMGRHYDATRPGAAKAETAGEKGHEGDGKDIEDVVDEHGPATHVTIHSHHEDGHVHKATHHDHESAHNHVAKAFDEEAPSEGGEHESDEDESHTGEGEKMPAIPGYNG